VRTEKCYADELARRVAELGDDPAMDTFLSTVSYTHLTLPTICSV